jgi:dienelactone hydrolase
VIVFGHGYPGNGMSTWMWLLSHRKGLTELVKLGYRVVMPIRIGQGNTGGPQLEGGGCLNTSEAFAQRIRIINSQLIQAADWVKQQDFALESDLVFVGQSAGGSGAIGLSADPQNPFKVLINFAAGSGKMQSPDFPCSPEAYADQIATYGKDSKIEMLWIYGLNDSYWGKKWPVKWASAYKNSGGTLEFYQVESNTMEGHNLFRQSPEVWVPIVKQFLEKHGSVRAAR